LACGLALPTRPRSETADAHYDRVVIPAPLRWSFVAICLALASCAPADGVAASPAPSLTALPDATPPPTAAEFRPNPPPAGTTVCDAYSAIGSEGLVAGDALTETSGIAASRSTRGVLWAHNDSGSDAAVHAVGTDGADLGTWVLEGITALDWEDIAVGPGPDAARSYLYIGDIGDNLAFRPNITVYRIPEPEVASSNVDNAPMVTSDVERIVLEYPSPGIDAEAIAIDPFSGDLFVLTKERGRSEVYRAAAAGLIDGEVTMLDLVATLDLPDGGQVTAADFTIDGTVIGLRGYEQVWLFSREDADAAMAFSTEPCPAPSPDEVQGEAFTFDPFAVAYFTVSEGSNPDVFRVTGP
jgi:hypothetical protein